MHARQNLKACSPVCKHNLLVFFLAHIKERSFFLSAYCICIWLATCLGQLQPRIKALCSSPLTIESRARELQLCTAESISCAFSCWASCPHCISSRLPTMHANAPLPMFLCGCGQARAAVGQVGRQGLQAHCGEGLAAGEGWASF